MEQPLHPMKNGWKSNWNSSNWPPSRIPCRRFHCQETAHMWRSSFTRLIARSDWLKLFSNRTGGQQQESTDTCDPVMFFRCQIRWFLQASLTAIFSPSLSPMTSWISCRLTGTSANKRQLHQAGRVVSKSFHAFHSIKKLPWNQLWSSDTVSMLLQQSQVINRSMSWFESYSRLSVPK